ncbi:cation:proton antiporter domain-containing protein [Streptomyces sp. NPDC054874]
MPLLLGVILIDADERAGALAPDVSLTVSGLFVGVALAVTAFPVLAGIIAERNLADTRFGAPSLSAIVVDDAAAWVLLVGVFGTIGGSVGKGLRGRVAG